MSSETEAESRTKNVARFRILALGDCVGKPGRQALKKCVPHLRKKFNLDFVVANVENATNGWGLRPKEADDILTSGVDVMTTGDHIRDRREIDSYLDELPMLLRPHNYNDMPGSGVRTLTSASGIKVAIANLCGRTFMDDANGNVLRWADACVEEMDDAPIKLFDIHAEATAEKVALGWYLDGRVSALWGTHTHVQTADERILPRGTGYITDLGFVGGHRSVLGREVEKVLNHMLEVPKSYMDVAKDWPQLDGAIFEIDPESGRCSSVERLQYALEEAADVSGKKS